ncbi:MAG TPA: hypothetical protein VF721_12385 [Pyrinomonadaceae bacterium]|jgi:hypothetical protein
MLGKIKTALFASGMPGLFLAVYFSWHQAKTENLLDCVSSVGNAIVEYSSIGKFARDDGNWYVLSETEVDNLLESFSIADCPEGFAGLPSDIREKKYRMAVRKTGRSQYDVRVWSNGFDNISGTRDDIVFPEGEKALK